MDSDLAMCLYNSSNISHQTTPKLLMTHQIYDDLKEHL